MTITVNGGHFVKNVIAYYLNDITQNHVEMIKDACVHFDDILCEVCDH